MNLIDRFWSKVCKVSPDECWEWVSGTRGKYGEFWMNKKNVLPHRVSYLINKGHIPTGKLVMHTCDNPRCVNPAHLKLGTRKDNVEDMVIKGRGPGASKRKITWNDVCEIRRLYATGIPSQKTLGKMFLMHQSKISRIITGKRLKIMWLSNS